MRFICEPPNDQQNENIAYFFHLNRFEIQSKRVHSANRMRTNAWNRFRKVSLKWPFTQQLRSLPRQQRALSLFCLFNLRQQQNQNVRMVACYFVVGLFWLLSASCRRATRQTHSNQQFIAIWISTLHMYGMMFIFGLFFFFFSSLFCFSVGFLLFSHIRMQPKVNTWKILAFIMDTNRVWWCRCHMIPYLQKHSHVPCG